MITVRSTINLAHQNVPNIIPVVQGDTGRAILFTLADFTIPEGATARYFVMKPSGLSVYNDATIDGNTVLVELTDQSIIETGDNYGQVRISVGDDIVTSFDFILHVDPFRGIDAVESTTETNIFDQAVETARETIDGMIEDAEQAIEDAAEDVLESIPADYTALSNEVDVLKSAIKAQQVGLVDLFRLPSFPDGTYNGITYTKNSDGTFTMTGTASARSFRNIVNGSVTIPDFLTLGDYYWLEIGGTASIVTAISNTGSFSDVVYTTYTKSSLIKIPADATQLVIRFDIASGTVMHDQSVTYKMIHIPNEILFNPVNGFVHISPDMYTQSFISDVLAKGYNIKLTKGTFEHTFTIDLPVGRTIEGSGRGNTILQTDGTLASCISCANGGNTIKDLTLKGPNTEPPANYSGGHNGIVMTGQDSGENIISNVSVLGFPGIGIFLYSNGFSNLRSLQITNCIIMFCGYGLMLGEYGEYAQIANTVMRRNFVGCYNNAGNNKFTNCGFDGNYTGLASASAENPGHSGYTGCSFNHNTQGIRLGGGYHPHAFIGCYLYQNSQYTVALSLALGAMFTGCMFGGGASLIGGNATKFFMTGCTFQNAPTFTLNEGSIKLLNACYLMDGSPTT